MRLLLIALIGLSTLVSSGCGTALNMMGDRQIYGGTIADADTVIGTPVSVFRGSDSRPACGIPQLGPIMRIVVGALALADLPLSIVGDTVTLPWTISSTTDLSDENLITPDEIVNEIGPTNQIER